MRTARWWVAGVALLALGLGIYRAERGQAGENKAVADAINKIADAFQKGDDAGAKKEAEALAKKVEDLYDVMDLFKPRKKGGLGVGPKPGDISPDGIELKLISLGRDAPTPTTMNKEAEALERMAYHAMAIAEVALAKSPTKDQGKKTKKDWVTWSNDTRDAAKVLAAAAKSKGAQDTKTAAAKVNTACNSCHSVFR